MIIHKDDVVSNAHLLPINKHQKWKKRENTQQQLPVKIKIKNLNPFIYINQVCVIVADKLYEKKLKTEFVWISFIEND